MEMVLPAGTPTLVASGKKNYTRPDNIFCNQDFTNHFIACKTDPSRRLPTTDCIPVLSAINLSLALTSTVPCLNYRETDWPTFKTDLKKALEGIPRPEEFTVGNFNAAFEKLMSALDSVI